MRTIKLILILLFTFSGCGPENGQKINVEQDGRSVVAESGTVIFMSFEGGFYGIISDSGDSLYPLNMPQKFKKDGLRIVFRAEPVPDASSVIWGKPVELVGINYLDLEQHRKK